jgi:hypothetical protein
MSLKHPLLPEISKKKKKKKKKKKMRQKNRGNNKKGLPLAKSGTLSIKMNAHSTSIRIGLGMEFSGLVSA